MNKPSDGILKIIFETIINGFFSVYLFNDNVKKNKESIVLATIELYKKITKELLPTPSKFHYTFNLRDLSKVFQGILMVKPVSIQSQETFINLWIHENCRVFLDRIVDEKEINWFFSTICSISNKAFQTNFTKANLMNKNLVFSDFMKLEATSILYEEINDRQKITRIIENYLDEFNLTSKANKIDLVLFDYAIDHILRISRVLRQPRGNLMLIGLSGSGKQSLGIISSFIMGCQIFKIEPSKNYKLDAFRQDLAKILMKTVVDRQKTTFILPDSQIIQESFLEDISNLLNSGEIPNLFTEKKEDFEELLEKVRPQVIKYSKNNDSPDGIYNYFIEQIRSNFHIILSTSPIGETLRIRCRKFPSLVNCSVLDWFPIWPQEALYSVAKKMLVEISISSTIKTGIAQIMSRFSVKVNQASLEFSENLKRIVFTTPKNFIDMIKLFISLLGSCRTELNRKKKMYSDGVEKLESSKNLVDELKNKLKDMQPQLELQSEKTEAVLAQLSVDSEKANQQEMLVEKETYLINNQTIDIKALAEEAQSDLSIAMPALIQAEEALLQLNKKDIAEIRTFMQPPQAVVLVLEAVLTLFGEKTDWASAKSIMMDVNFLLRLSRFFF